MRVPSMDELHGFVSRHGGQVSEARSIAANRRFLHHLPAMDFPRACDMACDFVEAPLTCNKKPDPQRRGAMGHYSEEAFPRAR